VMKFKNFSVLFIYPDNGQVGASFVRAENANHAFFGLAKRMARQGKDVDIICAIPMRYNRYLEYAGDGTVSSEVVLSQPEVFNA